jgi:hypothetical protein
LCVEQDVLAKCQVLECKRDFLQVKNKYLTKVYNLKLHEVLEIKLAKMKTDIFFKP